MKKLIHVTLLIFIVFPIIITDLNAQSLKIDLKIKNPTLSKIEPLEYEVAIINKTNQIQEIIPIGCRNSSGILEYKKKGSNKWIPLQESTQRNSFRFGVKICYYGKCSFSLKEFDTLKVDIKYMMFEGSYTDFNYLFQEGDKFKVRIAFQPKVSSKEVIYSNPVKVQITGYEGVDNQILQYLETTPQPHILYEALILPYVWGDHFEKTYYNGVKTVKIPDLTSDYFKKTQYNGVETAKTIINDYPTNSYTPWAYLHLAWYEYWSCEAIQDKKVNTKALIQSTNYAEKCLTFDDPTIRSLTKMLYGLVVNKKMAVGMYKKVDDYFDALEYVDNL